MSTTATPSATTITVDTITDDQIRALYEQGVSTFDLLEFATFPAWAATRTYYRARCAEILNARSTT